jgi:hypothetical protein
MRHPDLFNSAFRQSGILGIVLAVFFMLPNHLKAQVNSGVNFNQHFQSVAANNQPALLGEGFKDVEVGLANTYAWFSNNAISVETMNDKLTTDVLTDEDVNEVISEFQQETLFSIGATVRPVKVGVKIRDDQDQELFTFSLAAGAEVAGNIQLNRTLVSLAWNGNKQYVDQNISLGEININALPVRSYTLGLAAPFQLEGAGLDIRAGLKAQYLEGIGSAYTENGGLSLYTSPDARSLQMQTNLEANASVPDSDAEVSDVPVDIASTGTGFGLDLGVNVKVTDQISFMGSVADLGQVKFTEETNNFKRQGPYEFEGVEFAIGRPDDGGKELTSKADSVEDIIDFKETEESYTMPLGARAIFQTHLRINKDMHNNDTFYKHHIFIHYQQGFQNHLRATEQTFLSFGYTYNLDNNLNAGGNISFGGYSQLAAGPYISTQLGPFKLGIGSNNMLALIDKRWGNGGDVSFNMGLAF